MDVTRFFILILTPVFLLSCVHSPGPVPEAPAEAVPAVEEALEDEKKPAPDAGKEEPAPEVESPPPKPFTKAEIDARIFNLVYPGTRPVLKDGDILAVYDDLDGNGLSDVCVLCVEDAGADTPDFEMLSDDSRLFFKILEPFHYSIQFFLQKNGLLYRSGISRLGKKLVLESFRPLNLNTSGAGGPGGASAVFKARGGTEHEWVLFYSDRVVRFTMHESLSVIPVIDDIDQNGLIDVVLHHQGFEEGRGYETFLIWYRWNGREFEEYRSTNVVRNLNGFLDTVEELLVSGQWSAFSDTVLSKDQLRNLRQQGLQEHEILTRIFTCEKGISGGLFSPSGETGGFLKVVFPDFYETPFSREDANRFEIPVQVRFLDEDNRSSLCSAVIYMKRNPFEGQQFGFLIRDTH